MTKAHFSFALGALFALAASACSSTPKLARTATPELHCAGGAIRSDSDAARFTGCTAVIGDLRVEHSQLEDMNALASIRNVSGALVVADNPRLSELSGLEQLDSVGRLELTGNAHLSSVRGLSALRHAQVVEIRNNPSLTNVNGLEGLQQLERLDLANNGLFETAGLSSLRQVGKLTIADNARLISLRGLNGLTRAGSVQIRNNRLLCAQMGLLPQLGEVSDALVLSANRSVSAREIASLREHGPRLVSRASAERA